ARRARYFAFTSEQARQLAADGQSESGASVLPARPGVCLLERLENKLLLFRCDTDSGIRHRDSRGSLNKPKDRMIQRPTLCYRTHSHCDVPLRCELKWF